MMPYASNYLCRSLRFLPAPALRKRLGRIDRNITSGKFFSHMVDALIRSKLIFGLMEDIAFIGQQIGRFIKNRINEGCKGSALTVSTVTGITGLCLYSYCFLHF